MSFLPELNSKGEIVKKDKPSKKVRERTFDCSNLDVGRCPICGNYLKQEKKILVCRGADHQKPFKIKEKKLQFLKKKMLFSRERREQYLHLRNID